MALFLGGAALYVAATEQRISDVAYCKQTHSCDGPAQCAFYADGQFQRGKCFATEQEARRACPAGWNKLVEVTKLGCKPTLAGEVAEAFGGEGSTFRPVCERQVYANTTDDQKRACCLQNKSNNAECPPGYCYQRINDAPCYDLFNQACLQSARDLFFNPVCQQWVLDEAVRGKNASRRKDVAAAVTKFCKEAGRFGAAHPLCKCVLASEPGFCLENDCFARQSSLLADLAVCAAKPCVKPEKGTFVPPEPEGGCPTNICAPYLQQRCVNLTTECALNYLVTCGGEMPPEKRQELKSKYGFTDEQLDKAMKEQSQGRLTPIVTCPFIGDKTKTGAKVAAEAAAAGALPTWAIVLIVVGAVLLAIIIVVVVALAVSPQARSRLSEQWARRRE